MGARRIRPLSRRVRQIVSSSSYTLRKETPDFSQGRNCATVFAVARIPIDAGWLSRISGDCWRELMQRRGAEDATAYGTLQQPVWPDREIRWAEGFGSRVKLRHVRGILQGRLAPQNKASDFSQGLLYEVIGEGARPEFPCREQCIGP